MSPWFVRNAISVSAGGGPEYMATGMLDGAYPDYMLNGDPKTFLYPILVDPGVSTAVRDVPSALHEIARRFAADPLGMAAWYGFGNIARRRRRSLKPALPRWTGDLVMNSASNRVSRSAITVLASIAIFFLVRRAFGSLDIAWDAATYHLPFAARRVGLCDEHCLILSAYFENIYRSFPPLADIIQGFFWKVTGRPEATNLASLSALLLLIAYLRRFWLIHWGLAVVAMLAIPMVQIHATSSYIDLMTNVAATIAVLSLLMIVLHPERVNWKLQIVAVLSMIFLGNSKTQMIPVAALLGALFLLLENIYVQPEQRAFGA